MTEARPRPVKILLVDDRPGNLLLLESVLEERDRELFRASSGNEALKLLLAHDFAVVLLDVLMPDMDGYETAEIMRADARGMTVPIIFVTAGDRGDLRRFLGSELGPVDVITKPIDAWLLKSKVAVFVELQRMANDVRALRLALERTRTVVPELRSRSRSIDELARALADRHAGRLDADADLRRIGAASREIEEILDGLD